MQNGLDKHACFWACNDSCNVFIDRVAQPNWWQYIVSYYHINPPQTQNWSVSMPSACKNSGEAPMLMFSLVILSRSLSLLLSLSVLSMLLGGTWSPRFILCCAEKNVHSSDPSEKARSNSGLSLPCCSVGHRCWGKNNTVTAMRADCDCTSDTATNGSRFTQILPCFDVNKMSLRCYSFFLFLQKPQKGRWRGGFVWRYSLKQQIALFSCQEG